MFLSELRVFPSAPCLARKKKPWQLASRCCWNRARPWHASDLVSFLVGLRTDQHPGNSCFLVSTFIHLVLLRENMTRYQPSNKSFITKIQYPHPSPTAATSKKKFLGRSVKPQRHNHNVAHNTKQSRITTHRKLLQNATQREIDVKIVTGRS